MDEPKPETSSPQSPLTIDQAFQRLLERSGKPYSARRRLDEAFLAGDAPLWGRLAPDEPWFLVKPDYYQSQQYFIEVHEGPEGWQAKLGASTAQQEESGESPWAQSLVSKTWNGGTSAEKIDALCQPSALTAADEPLPRRTIGERSGTPTRRDRPALRGRGCKRLPSASVRKPPLVRFGRSGAVKRSMIGNCSKLRIYLTLYDEDLPANADINISEEADKLMLWGQNHPDIGPEKELPGTPRFLRAGVTEWAPRWRVLGQKIAKSNY